MSDCGDQNISKLVEVSLDEGSIGRTTPDIEHEREIAIFDLLESNAFELKDGQSGPYTLKLSIIDGRLVFDIGGTDNKAVANFVLSPAPFRKIVKDYFLICESYYEAIKTAPPSKIEAVDIGRREIHDEGAKLLMERLEENVSVDMDTARRLFTLICALHWKG